MRIPRWAVATALAATLTGQFTAPQKTKAIPSPLLADGEKVILTRGQVLF